MFKQTPIADPSVLAAVVNAFAQSIIQVAQDFFQGKFLSSVDKFAV